MRLVLAVLLLVSMAPIAAGQGRVQPPPGWSSQPERNGIVMRSPADAAGHQVVYAIRAAEPVSGSAEAWFSQLMARTVGVNTVVQRSGVQREQSLLKETVIVRGGDGRELRVDAIAYPTPQGQQLMLVISPTAIGAQDPRLNQAYDHIAALWRSGYRLTATGTAPPGTAPPGTAPPRAQPQRPVQPGAAPPRTAQPAPSATPGRNCRREPVWGQRMSVFCKPTGICPDRVIKEYRTVCS